MACYGLLDPCNIIRRENDLEGPQCIGELLSCARADYGYDAITLRQRPCTTELRGRDVLRLRQSVQCFNKFLVVHQILTTESWKMLAEAVGSGRLGASQQTPRKDTVRRESDPQLLA